MSLDSKELPQLDQSCIETLNRFLEHFGFLLAEIQQQAQLLQQNAFTDSSLYKVIDFILRACDQLQSLFQNPGLTLQNIRINWPNPDCAALFGAVKHDMRAPVSVLRSGSIFISDTYYRGEFDGIAPESLVVDLSVKAEQLYRLFESLSVNPPVENQETSE